MNNGKFAHYCGRFAPSPTGALHLGSLAAAMASFLHARGHGGHWLIRIEDVDHTRSSSQIAEQHCNELAQLGLISDAPIVWQSQRSAYYQAALDQLAQLGVLYACQCSRQNWASQKTVDGACACRDKRLPFIAHAVRLNLAAPAVLEFLDNSQVFIDAIQGQYEQHLPSQVGDFVLRRADGIFSYQLAVVVDDAAQGVTDVVRGVDLLDNTPRQILLQQLLGLATPRYAHINVVLAADGKKLSKQNGAKPLTLASQAERVQCLLTAATHLGWVLPETGKIDSVEQFWLGALTQNKPS